MRTISIINLECAPSVEGMADVVKNILFHVTDDVVIAENTYQVTGGDTVTLADPNPESFTPFAELTEAEVVAWIESTYNVDALVERLTTNLQQQVAPAIVPMTPPWQA